MAYELLDIGKNPTWQGGPWMPQYYSMPQLPGHRVLGFSYRLNLQPFQWAGNCKIWA